MKVLELSKETKKTLKWLMQFKETGLEARQEMTCFYLTPDGEHLFGSDGFSLGLISTPDEIKERVAETTIALDMIALVGNPPLLVFDLISEVNESYRLKRVHIMDMVEHLIEADIDEKPITKLNPELASRIKGMPGSRSHWYISDPKQPVFVKNETSGVILMPLN